MKLVPENLNEVRNGILPLETIKDDIKLPKGKGFAYYKKLGHDLGFYTLGRAYIDYKHELKHCKKREYGETDEQIKQWEDDLYDIIKDIKKYGLEANGEKYNF